MTKLVVIMNSDPDLLRVSTDERRAIETVYKFESLGVKVMKKITLGDILRPSASSIHHFFSFFNRFNYRELNPTSEYAKYIEPYMLRNLNTGSYFNEYVIIELDGPEEHFDSVFAGLKSDPFIEKVGERLTDYGCDKATIWIPADRDDYRALDYDR